MPTRAGRALEPAPEGLPVSGCWEGLGMKSSAEIQRIHVSGIKREHLPPFREPPPCTGSSFTWSIVQESVTKRPALHLLLCVQDGHSGSSYKGAQRASRPRHRGRAPQMLLISVLLSVLEPQPET